MALNYLYVANNTATDGTISQVESKGVVSANYTVQNATTTVDGATFNTNVRFLLSGGVSKTIKFSQSERF